MLARTILLLILAISARAATDVTVFHWHERHDEKQGGKVTAFFVGPTAVKEVFDAQARRDEKAVQELGARLPKDAWDCIVELRGEARTYLKDKITLAYMSPPKTIVEIVSGSVAVDRAKKTLRIALKIVLEGKVVDFAGNGVYPIPPPPPAPEGGPETLARNYDDKAMDAAIATARRRVDEFIAILARKGADSFSVKAPIKDANGTEHFWITDVTYANGAFTGQIGNDPGIVKNVKLGQTWTVKKEDISDWMYEVGDKIHGGFTIDPLLDSFPKEQADELRKKLVR